MPIHFARPRNHFAATILALLAGTILAGPASAQLIPNLPPIQPESTATSPESPSGSVAGTPVSAQNLIISDAFQASASEQAASTETDDTVTASGGTPQRQLAFGVSSGYFRTGGTTAKPTILPLGLTMRFLDDPRYQLQLGLPLAYVDFSDGHAYQGTGSVGFQFPLGKAWLLTPRVAYSMVDDSRADETAHIFGATLTSRYDFTLADQPLSFLTTLGWTKGLPFSLPADSRFENFAIKNGLTGQVPVPWKLFGRETSVDMVYAYTQFTGTDLFINGLHEVAFSWGVAPSSGDSIYSMLRIGPTVSLAPDHFGLNIGLSYTF